MSNFHTVSLVGRVEIENHVKLLVSCFFDMMVFPKSSLFVFACAPESTRRKQ